MAVDRTPASLIAALGFAALVPVACVLWFMNVAMRNERLAVQERVAEVYSNQLGLLQRQVNAFWSERQAALASVAGESAAEKFAAIARGGLTDAVVVCDPVGKPLYPVAAGLDAPVEEKVEWIAARDLEYQKKDYAGAAAAYAKIAETSRDVHAKARALQAEATCWLKAGNQREALVHLSQVAGDPALRSAISVQGTLIAPNAQLMLVKLLAGENGSRDDYRHLYQRTLDDLVARLNDYSAANFPATQRRFLMREVQTLAEANAAGVPRPQIFPTLAAEYLAAEYLEADPSAPSVDGKLQRTSLARVWQMATRDRTVIALFREERLKAETEKLFAMATLPDVRVQLLTPDESFVASKLVPPLGAGEFLPGWRLGLSFRNGDPLAEASARQSRFYLWIGFFVVITIALLALLVARYVSAQMRLARLKNELVSTVSHELKTPLASMRALVDTLVAGRYGDERQLREYLALIASENQRLSHLIENFLTFSRLERGKQPFRFEALAPDAIVTAATVALREKFESAGCQLAVEIPGSLPAIRGDADALTTVLVNLLDNACKYSDTDKRIVARAYANCATVCFEVEDHGIGLRPGDTERIFERFYQVDQSLTRQRGGCGLGLSIVRSIVRAHGGSIEVASELGKGSTFRVKVPIDDSSRVPS